MNYNKLIDLEFEYYIKYHNLELYFKLLFLVGIIFFVSFKKNYIFNNQLKNKIKNKNDNNKILNKNIFIYESKKNFFFKIKYMQYSFSLKYKITRLEYQFGFYHNNELIIPSDLTLYYKFHLFCYINDTIFSLPNIYNDSYYQCIKLFNINDKIKFGIKIVRKNKYNSTYSFIISSSRIINYNNFKYNNDNSFDPLIINSQYRLLKQKIIDANEKNISFSIKASYIQQPKFSVKKTSIKIYNFWIFINLYNYYFCLCKGKKCLNIDINQKCKYSFYLNIIDKNRFIYKKTDYLFGDFILSERSSDDTFPVFREMIKMKITAYYMTENLNIYEKYCNNNKYCKSVLLVKTKLIDGDFLEKYLTIILKLKAAITGDQFSSIDNLFYNIDYITYICVGHGVAILKQFLYSNNSYYSYNIFNKILLPPSEKIIIAFHFNISTLKKIKLSVIYTCIIYFS